MKKLNIILVILILLLSFTLIGNCWVAGYDQRIKLTIDNTKIDAGLSDFPVTAFFTVTQAEEIFAEFDADEDFDRGQFALEDDTLLYAEKELFDDSASLAIYHIKIPTVSSSADTDYYFYYDNDAGHNTSYIGAINTVAGAAVWNANFKAVHHMVDDNGNVDDSTSAGNDGTKVGDPTEIAGHIGQAQDFDGDDYVSLTSNINFGTLFTAEFWIKPSLYDYGDPLGRKLRLSFVTYADGHLAYYIGDGAWGEPILTGESELADGNWYYIVGTYNGSQTQLFINNADKGTAENTKNIGTIPVLIGARDNLLGGAMYLFDGIIDEVRISDIVRTPAWIKGTFNSGNDDLLTYGSEETSEVEPTYNYYGHFIK